MSVLRAMVVLVVLFVLCPPAPADDVVTPPIPGWPAPPATDVARPTVPPAAGWPVASTEPPSPIPSSWPVVTPPPAPTTTTEPPPEPPTVVHPLPGGTAAPEPEPRDFLGFSKATSRVRCAASGMPLGGRYYRMFGNEPRSALSYEATMMVVARTQATRTMYWRLTSLLLARDYATAVTTVLTEARLLHIDDSDPAHPTATEQALADFVSSHDEGERRDFETNVARALRDIDTDLERRTWGRLALATEHVALQRLLASLPQRVRMCATADQAFLGNQTPLFPENVTDETLGRAYLLSRLLLDYMAARVHECQSFVSPPVPSSPTIQQTILADLRRKALTGTGSIIEDRLFVAPVLSTTVKSVLGTLLFLVLLPGCFYFVRRQSLADLQPPPPPGDTMAPSTDEPDDSKPSSAPDDPNETVAQEPEDGSVTDDVNDRE